MQASTNLVNQYHFSSVIFDLAYSSQQIPSRPKTKHKHKMSASKNSSIFRGSLHKRSASRNQFLEMSPYMSRLQKYRPKPIQPNKNPGSIVDIEYALVGKKMRFTKMFIALRSCVEGFLNGFRPFLGVDSIVLIGQWSTQLTLASSAVEGHNWHFLVAYGVFESDLQTKWYFEKLQTTIASPHGLVISTDAGKGIYSAVTLVFSNGVEHKECMRHLVNNFQKRHRGGLF